MENFLLEYSNEVNLDEPVVDLIVDSNCHDLPEIQFVENLDQCLDLNLPSMIFFGLLLALDWSTLAYQESFDEFAKKLEVWDRNRRNR